MKQFYILLLALISFTSSAQEVLKDILKSNGSSHPRNMVNADGKFFYLSGSSSILITRGSEETTQLLSNINTQSPRIDEYTKLYPLGDKVLFTATYDGVLSFENKLWISDGTIEGTKVLKDIYRWGSANPRNFVNFGDKMLFVANNGTHGEELWITDGTSGGTALLKDIEPGFLGSNALVSALVVAENKCYFTATTQDNGEELWVTNGTIAGTYLIKDINIGAESSKPSNLTSIGNKLFFSADNGTNGIELWVTDGTTAGTSLVKDIATGQLSAEPSLLTVLNGKLIFKAKDANNDDELWISDGSAIGTTILKNINVNASSSPEDLTKVGNLIVFTASNGINGRELWKTDGTLNGTVLLKDINVNSSGDSNLSFLPASNRKFFSIDNMLYFLANNGNTGFELW